MWKWGGEVSSTGSAVPGNMTFAEFARHAGFKASYVTQLKREGRLVLSDDGKAVKVAESLARIHDTRDPSKAGVAARHAAARGDVGAEGHLDSNETQQTPQAAPQRAADPVGSGYQAARAVRERYLALDAKRAYEQAIGALRDAKEVEGLVASAMTELRLRLEGLASSMAPELAAIADETRVRAYLADEFHHALESASHHFSKLATRGHNT